MSELPVKFPVTIQLRNIRSSDLIPRVAKKLKNSLLQQDYEAFSKFTSLDPHEPTTAQSHLNATRSAIQQQPAPSNAFSQSQADALVFLASLIPAANLDSFLAWLPSARRSLSDCVSLSPKAQTLSRLSEGAAFCVAMKRFDDQKHLKFVNFSAKKPTEKKLNFRKLLTVLMGFPTFTEQISFKDIEKLIIGDESAIFKLIYCIRDTINSWNAKISYKMGASGAKSVRQTRNVEEDFEKSKNEKALLSSVYARDGQLLEYIDSFANQQELFVQLHSTFIANSLNHLRLPQIESDDWKHGKGLLLLLQKICNDELLQIIQFQYKKCSDEIERIGKMLTFISTDVKPDQFYYSLYYKSVVLVEIFGASFIQKHGFQAFKNLMEQGQIREVCTSSYTRQQVMDFVQYFFEIDSQTELVKIMVQNKFFNKLLGLVRSVPKIGNGFEQFKLYCDASNIPICENIQTRVSNGTLDGEMFQFLSSFFESLFRHKAGPGFKIVGNCIEEEVKEINLLKLCQVSKLETWMWE